MTSAVRDHAEPVGARTRIRLMGVFSVTNGDGPIDLPSDGQRLVAFLALRRVRVPRALVAGTLWMDGSQDRAFGNLRSALWRVHRHARTLIDSDAASLGLAAEVAVDTDDLTTLGVNVCGGYDARTDPRCDPAVFAEELLPGWYDEWTLVERERLRQVSLHALESLANGLTSAGDYASAIQAALAAIRLEPLRESSHRCLIRTHLAEGNRSEAIRAYREYADRLERELGIDPSPLLRELPGMGHFHV